MSKGRLAVSAIIMGVCNSFKILLQLLVAPALARLLGPVNFGIFSLAQPSINFVMMLADAGLGQSLAREPEENEAVWSSAFWLLQAVGIALAGIVCLWSAPLAWLSRQPMLPAVMAPLSLSVVLLTLSVAPSARLTRRGRIETYSLVDLGANLCGAGLAVGMAIAGLGVWSLVGQALCAYSIRAIGLNACAWRTPRWRLDWSAVRPHTLLGGGIVLTKFLDSFGRMAEATIVGRRFGSGGLGMYAFAGQAAWSLVQGVNNPAGTMIYAHAIRTNSPEEIRALYARVLRLTAILTLGGTAIVSALAPVLAATILGHAWASGVLLIALIFPSQAIGTLGQLASAVIYAQGRARSQVWVAAGNSILRLVAVAVPFGGWPMLAVYLAGANLIYFVLGLINARRQLGWSIGKSLGQVRGAMLASVVGGVAAYYCSRLAPVSVPGLALDGVVGGLAFCAALTVFDLRRVREDLAMGMALLRRRGGRDLAAG